MFGACAALALAVMAARPADAAYQKDDRINLIVGYEAGGGYDIYARFVAPYLTKHLPNNPRIVVQNMPGAGSLKAANFLYNVAPKDGTVIGSVGQGVPQMEILGQPGIQFEADKFNWIGRISDVRSLIGVWHEAPVKTIEDVKNKEATIAIGGPISGSTLYVMFLNELVGTKMKPIAGYSSREAMLAMERREIDGSSSILWTNLESGYPSWISEKKINILVQIGTERDPNLKDVPLLSELAKNEQDKRILDAIASSDLIGRSLLAPPSVPKERVDALRKAMAAALKDPEALAAAKKMKVDIGPLDGAALQKLVEDTSRLSPELVKKIRAVLDANKTKK
jgi:tripartite-type tricarboxylate transporter receptor subunit TctC